MSLQQEISNENNKKLINKEIECLIEDLNETKDYYIGRSYMDTPEIDGYVYIENSKEHKIGDFIKCKIKEAYDYDLVAEEV